MSSSKRVCICERIYPHFKAKRISQSPLTPAPQGKDLDYEAMAREHRALAGIIREHSGGKRVEPDDKLLLRTQVRVGVERGSISWKGSPGRKGGQVLFSSNVLLGDCLCMRGPLLFL